MGVLINPFDPPEAPREEPTLRTTTGPRGYFSERTVRRARAYRDISWMHLLWQTLIAVSLVAIGFAIGPGFLGPVLGLTGASIALITLYVVTMKAIGTTLRR